MTRAHSRVLIAVLAAVGLILGVAGAAFADTVADDANSSGNSTITAGGSTTITYTLSANSSPNGDANGCNASTTSPVTVTIHVPAGVTAPSSVTFTGCGNANSASA